MNWSDEKLVGRTVLGRYRVVMPLGRGGQGMVYLARGEGAAGFARPVVVKRVLTPLAEDPLVIEQFAREARITSQLRHPDIVPVIDFERDGGSYVMVLEYVHGYDLRRWERFVHQTRGKLIPELVAYVMARVLDALHYAHTLRGPDGTPRRVIHRDISPANVLIDIDGHVKLTDFGIARMDAEEVTVGSSVMQIKGKLPYVAPELYQGAMPSVATDVYACGVMLHELLVGKNEFRAGNALETLALASAHLPTRVDALRSDVSKEYADIVARALAKDPAERFASAFDFANALRSVVRAGSAEVELLFREVIRQDFSGPEITAHLGTPPLSQLDQAWRSAHEVPVPTATRSASLPYHVEDRTTVADEPLVTAPTSIGLSQAREPKARAQRVGLGTTLALAAVALSLSASALFIWKSGTRSAAKVVYVQREMVAGEADELAHEPSEADRAHATDTVQASTSARRARNLTTLQPTPPTPSPNPDDERAARISAAFARKRPLVERCFARYAKDVPGHASIHVQFTVTQGGSVTHASLVPDSLTSTDFGRCVVRVASSTRFGPQPSVVAFRIPVTARVVR